MLTSYLTATSNLLQSPGAPNPLYSTANLTTYINTARGQVAGEAACVRAIGHQVLTVGASTYAFPSITFTGLQGIAGVLNVRSIWLAATLGVSQFWVPNVTWEEFSIYALNGAATTAPPQFWAQYGQGALGSYQFSPNPDLPYTAVLDCVCYPSPLALDTDPEAIPYLWTDAVPYFAAYLALLSAQTGVRTQEADAMFKRYEEFVDRARRAATPAVLSWQFEQAAVPGGINQPAPPPAGRG